MVIGPTRADQRNQVPFQSRPVVRGTQSAVATPHVHASQAALDVLDAGGNAIDAAVTAAAVSAVVQPFSSSIGGVGWAAVHLAAPNVTEVLEFSGTVPRGLDVTALHADRSGLIDSGRLEREGRALLASLSPAVALGWAELVRAKGRWTLDRVLAPAIHYASEGFPVSELLHEVITSHERRLRRWPASAAIFLPHGHPPHVGELLVQSDLANTLRAMCANGPAELMSGSTARHVVRFATSHGGAVCEADLAETAVTWHAPLSARYRGHVVRAAPAPLGDVSFLCGVQILDTYPPFGSPGDPGYVHVSIESAKLVAEERRRLLGHLVSQDVTDRLLSGGHIAELRASIGPSAAPFATASPVEDTITLAVVDGDGNAVNLMQTVGSLFGTAAVVPGTGILLNSSLGFGYPESQGANRIIAGGKIEQNPCLAMVFDGDGRIRLVAGSPGGKTRVETVRQILTNVLDFGMNLQQAVDAPRFLRSPAGTEVHFEGRYGRLDAQLRFELESRGHRINVVNETFGSGQAVAIDHLTSAREGAADWRLESVALASSRVGSATADHRD